MKALLPVLIVVAALLCAGCNDETSIVEPEKLAPPLGLQSITGDEQVTLFWWCSNFGDDLMGFKVYMREGDFDEGSQEEIPSGFDVVDSLEVAAPCSGQHDIDITGLTNGTTYSFLVVAARDDWHEISHTSNIVPDTPRPETASEVRLYAKQVEPEAAGFQLSGFSVVDVSDINEDYETPGGIGDVMVERFNPGAGIRLWLDGINDGVIQDIGYMRDLEDADVAPPDGYAATGHSVEALMGHVYAVRTGDNHYAKLQVVGLDTSNSDWVEIKAAYQTDVNNRQYK